MLVEFTVGNFRSIRDKQTFSMEATKLRSSAQHRDAHEGNTFEVEPKLRLLTSAALYGANASGKSNLVKALRFFKWFVLESFRSRLSGGAMKNEPFLLTEKTKREPTYFEAVFIIEKRRFRYGFCVDAEHVVEEWLFEMGVSSEKTLFMREGQNFKVQSRNFPEGKGLEERTRSNALFLTVCALFNGETALLPIRWFDSLFVGSGLDDLHYGAESVSALQNPAERNQVIEFVRRLDTGISSLRTVGVPVDVDELNSLDDILRRGLLIELDTTGDSRSFEVKTEHPKFSSDGQIIEGEQVTFDLFDHESDGTRKLFYLAGVLLKTLREGGAMIVDELDSRLHPLMTCAIIQLFGDRKSNPHGAQLIFTTHDTNLLSNSLFRRDQIWFAEKDAAQGTKFYSLAEFPVRYDSNIEMAYVRGKFGAIPYLGDLSEIASEMVLSNGKQIPEGSGVNGSG